MTTMLSSDGRVARRQRNREAVVDAALELVDEGTGDLSVDALTERSGLSARSIFRYFEGLDDLRRAVIHRNFEKVELSVDSAAPDDLPLEERIRRFVDDRTSVCEGLAGAARMARSRAPHVATVAEDILRFRQLLDEQVRRYFQPELSARKGAEATELALLISTLVSWDSWEQLTATHGRSRTQLKRAWRRGIAALLAS